MTVDLQQNTVILSIRIGTPGNRRKVSSAQVEVDADKTAVHVSKELVKSPILADIMALDTELRRWMYSRSLPSRVLKQGMQLHQE